MSSRDGGQIREAALVVNMQARNAKEVYSHAKNELEQQGIHLFADYPVENPGKVPKIVKDVLESQPPMLILGGGDGTISAVAGTFAYRDVTLGILPLGTGNDLANSLGIPLDISEACKVIAHGREGFIDLGQVNEDYFIHSVLIGYLAHVSHTIPVWFKKLFGRNAYTLAGLFTILMKRSFRTAISFNGAGCELATTFIMVGNGRYHAAGKYYLPDWQSSQDKLFAYAPRTDDRATLFKLGLAYLYGKPVDPGLLCTFVEDEMKIEAEPVQEVNTDGEVSTYTPVRLKRAAKAVRVMLPP